jgi:hypothetical protein
LVAGEGGAIASKNRGILPWALVDLNYSGPFTTNLSFVTPGAIGNNVRPLDPGEYEIDPTVFGGTAQGVATNSNVLLTALSGGSLAMTANTQRNSLTIEGNAGLALADGVQFNLRSGGILVRPGSTSTISGGVLNQVSSLSGFNIWTVGDLTISSSLAGGNGIGNGAPSRQGGCGYAHHRPGRFDDQRPWCHRHQHHERPSRHQRGYGQVRCDQRHSGQ